MRRAIVTGAFALFCAACTIMNGLKLDTQAALPPPGDDDDDTDAKPRTDAKTDGSVSPAGCVLKKAPKKPAKVTGGTDTGFVVALRRMVSSNSGPKVGLDLDNLCTCKNGEREACKPKGADTNCDPEDGLDNSASEAFNALVSGSGGLNIIEDANVRIASGFHGNVFEIEGYNGQADDEAITVTWFPSPGLGTGVNFNVVHAWPVAAPVVAKEAYVAGKVLVAVFDTIDILFLDDTPTPPKLVSATLTGTIADVGGQPTLGRAILAGRANTTSLIQGVGQLKPPQAFGFALCETPQYQGTATGVCAKSDLPAGPADDGTQAACDSISMALNLELTPATVGSTQSIPTISDRCGGQTPVSCN